MSVKVGEKAPEFEAEGTTGKVSLKSFKGKWVVLFFYPLSFTGVCASELPEFEKRLKQFKDANAEVVGCSVDSTPTHKAFIEKLGGIHYPVISDLTKAIGRAYDVMLEDKGFHLRAAFLIDPEGKVRYQVVHEPAIGRSVQEIYRVLKALQAGGSCGAEWQPGQKTI